MLIFGLLKSRNFAKQAKSLGVKIDYGVITSVIDHYDVKC